MTAGAPTHPAPAPVRRFTLAQHPEWWPWLGWLALSLAAGALILYLTRSTTLWTDEWLWALYRRAGVHSLLASYNGHLSLVPILIYRAMFATAGIDSYLPLRVLVVLGHLACGGLVFAYARRRVGSWLALVATAVLLFLGPGWQEFLWPFQIAWLISITSGIGAMMALERGDRSGEIAATALLVVSVASSSVGVAVLAGAIVELALSRAGWRHGWVAAIPLSLYAAWSLAYQDTTVVLHDVFSVPEWAAGSAAAATSSLTGLSGQSINDNAGTVLTFGVPLSLAGLGLVTWRARWRGPLSGRAWSWAAISIALWVLTAMGRAFIGHPYDSRYEYVDAVFVLLFAVEVAAGLSTPRWLLAGVTVAGAGAVLSNIGVMRDAAGFLRSQAPLARADLAALDIARPLAPPSYVAGSFPQYPLVVVRAGAYYAMQAAIGSPAYSGAKLAAAPEPARYTADAELAALDRLSLRQGSARPPRTGSLPRLDSVSGGTVSAGRRCLAYQPAAVTAAGGDQVTVSAPPDGLWISSSAGGVVAVRRFGSQAHALRTLSAGARAQFTLAADTAPEPWRVQLQSPGRTLICGG